MTMKCSQQGRAVVTAFAAIVQIVPVAKIVAVVTVVVVGAIQITTLHLELGQVK